MRPGQNKRMRGRPNTNNGGGGNRKGPNPLTRSYESNGPDVKIRGNAHHVAEKYLQLARDAQSSGDPVAAESYLQHAEHYFRLIASAQAAQAGYARQPDAVDTEGEDEDDSGIPDRFASPQAPAPFVPQPVAPQPYQAERQPYNGERQPYNGQNGQGGGGERQPYGDRQNGERPPYGDRNNYQRQDRQDRNGLNRRPYRENNGGEVRADDRQPAQPGQERPYQDRPFQDRNGQDRQSRRERFAQERQERSGNGQERAGQERTGQERNGQERAYADRGYERPRDDSERVGDPQAVAQQADFTGGEQPRIEAAPERQLDVQAPSVPEPARQPDPAPAFDTQPEAPPRRSETPRRRERPERAAPAPVDDAPGLPSFITTPTRVASPSEAAPSEPSLATATAFPGDDSDGAPKFPRRRRRTTRATADGDAPGAGADQPPSDD